MLLEIVKKKNLIGYIDFLGFRSDTDVLYSAADAFVLSIRSEGLPMVMLESMMVGLPVVAMDVGAVRGILPLPDTGR